MKILGGLVAVYVVTSGTLFAAILQSPDAFARTMKHVPWAAFMVLPFKPLWMTAPQWSRSRGRYSSRLFAGGC
jgi:hypothetical protein